MKMFKPFAPALMTTMTLTAALLSSASASSAELTVEVKGINNNRGKIYIAVYDKAEGWMKKPVTANTSVVLLGDKLLAMWEGGSAYELDPNTLETRGPVAWKPELKAMPFSAHPKVEADGTFWNFGSVMMGKTILYHLSAKGDLLRYHLVDAPPSAMVHDFAVSQKHIIFLLAPITLDRALLKAGGGLGEAMRWNANVSVKVLIIDKADFTKQRLLELPAFMVFHFGNAWEENNVIRVDFVKNDNLDTMSDYMPKIMRGEQARSDDSHAAFLKIDLNTGRLTMGSRKEQVEFSWIDPRFVAVRNRQVFYPTYVGAAEKVEVLIA